MQLRLPFAARPSQPKGRPSTETLLLDRRPVTVTYVRHRRARHYVLRVQEDGSVRATIPRGGSRAEADRFLKEKAEWIERERYRAELRRAAAREAAERASDVMLRGERLPIELGEAGGRRVARFGAFDVVVPPTARSPLPAIEHLLRQLAVQELPKRLLELAAPLGYRVAGVTVRGQRTRWGSCSPSGRISLNWRLVQMPPQVCDYVLLHELTHLRHLNHSKRFWHELERVCPWHREARAWLKTRTAGQRGAL